jgi:hypothetical protein
MRDLVETLRTPPGRPFPVIAAYDGHRVHGPDAQPGRVVTDATWHHFFNINTQPFKVGPSAGE